MKNKNNLLNKKNQVQIVNCSPPQFERAFNCALILSASCSLFLVSSFNFSASCTLCSSCLCNCFCSSNFSFSILFKALLMVSEDFSGGSSRIIFLGWLDGDNAVLPPISLLFPM